VYCLPQEKEQGSFAKQRGKTMATITLNEIIAALPDNDDSQKTIFMKQGKGGKVVHLSAGSCRENNLLCGVTYSRNGNRSSYLFSLTGYKEIEIASMCKNCMAQVEWHKNAKASA
jgi:hypothetical protein